VTTDRQKRAGIFKTAVILSQKDSESQTPSVFAMMAYGMQRERHFKVAH
jgi:hypothetical protein